MEGNPASIENRAATGFAGRMVLSFESRRSKEIAALIESYGGRPIVAPAVKEVPAESSVDIPRFATALLQGKLNLVIFLTGVGTRALARAIEPFCPREQFIASLSKVPVLARGPKPVTALKELGVPITWNVPEPNTWREIIRVLETNRVPLQDQQIAVQEYGIPSRELVAALKQRGAEILTVHVYDWALPEDTSPLKSAVTALLESRIDVVLFTAAVQVHHLFQIAEEMGSKEALISSLSRARVASIGPVTSSALAEYGVRAKLEPTHPRMGFLVREAAESTAN
jgi:uroporphyrinogen-III synthase